jgi:hypothetical protein
MPSEISVNLFLQNLHVAWRGMKVFTRGVARTTHCSAIAPINWF